VVYYYPELTYDIQKLIQWSMKFEPKRAYKKPNLNVIAVKMNQIKEQWVKVLIDNPQIVGTKGKLGRNNVIFTLSLAYYASKIEQERCFDDMDVFNSSLNYPLSVSEVKRIVKSAYSGKYKGASKTYVQELVSNWGLELLSEEKMFTQQRNTWYKFKKERHKRKNSHLSEWKKDILDYLETQCYRNRPEVSMKKTDLQAAITFNGQSIPKRSLDRALKELIAEGKLFVQIKAGRGGGLVVATRKALIRTVIQVKQQVKYAYKQGIKTFFKEADMLARLFEQTDKNSRRAREYKQLKLWNTG
ncbi:RepS protein, partial [Enterococcus faecalis]|nr:RepS protein [Enterococcus faecalis]